jgi:hypothetical protein
MANVVVSAIATFNGKALKKGKKELSAFDKQAQQLGKTFNRVFATTAIVAFSKKAINAFANDEKAAKSLAVQLENTGNAFRVNEVETYIAGLQNLYGVLDDQLRPAFQTLLNATGSVTLSQKALETALNVSAGTGKDLESVVAAIAKGASGTTTALSRLGTGLDKATIASGDMNKIMAALDKKFAGQAQARLSTYAGKMDLLKVAAANATEIIGKGLIDAISTIGKDNSIDQAATSMNNFAIAIANTTNGMAQLIGEVKKIIDSDVGKFLLGLTALLTLGKKQVIAGAVGLIAYDIGKTQNAAPGSSTSRVKDMNITTKLFKARNEEYKIITASNKAKSELDKLKDKFDLERIGLTVALNAATDEETKLRIRAQLAILDNNEALAKKILAEMNGVKAVDELATAMNTAAKSILTAGQMVLLGLGVSPSQMSGSAITGTGGFPDISNLANSSFNNPNFGTSAEAMGLGLALGFTPGGGSNAPQEIKITVDTTAGGDRLSQAIAESIQIATKNGFSTVPAGQGF